MDLVSPQKEVQHPQAYIFDFLSKVKNWEVLMPEQTERFGVKSEESFFFQLKGMPEIRLRMEERNPNSLLVLGSDSEKFEFYLSTDIQPLNENTCEVQFLFEGKFNAVMKMMVKKPLENFILNLSQNLKKIQ